MVSKSSHDRRDLLLGRHLANNPGWQRLASLQFDLSFRHVDQHTIGICHLMLAETTLGE
jgi:hypothetical protein